MKFYTQKHKYYCGIDLQKGVKSILDYTYFLGLTDTRVPFQWVPFSRGRLPSVQTPEKLFPVSVNLSGPERPSLG